MSLEISSSDPQTVALLQQIHASDPENTLDIPESPMEGKDVFTLVIENYTSISIGTAALIAALKMKIDYLKVSKNGIELRGAAKAEALNARR